MAFPPSFEAGADMMGDLFLLVLVSPALRWSDGTGTNRAVGASALGWVTGAGSRGSAITVRHYEVVLRFGDTVVSVRWYKKGLILYLSICLSALTSDDEDGKQDTANVNNSRGGRVYIQVNT